MLTAEKTIATLNSAPELSTINESRAEQITATFEPMAKMLAGFEADYDEVIEAAAGEVSEEVTARARRLRIDISKVRIATEGIRKTTKEEYLRAGKAIDGVSNILKWAISDKEKKLKEIEDHFETRERERLDAIRSERESAISPYVLDASINGLAEMADDVWSAYLAAKKKEHGDRLAAEKQAEEDRIAKEKAEAAERERIKKENERLKAEAEKAERKAKAESEERTRKARAEAEERDRKEKAEAKERERKAKEEAAERGRLAAIEKAKQEEAEVERRKLEAEKEAAREAERQAEREEREKLEAELLAKQEAEQKRLDDAEAERQAALKQDDADKVRSLVAHLSEIKTSYSFKSAKNRKMFAGVVGAIDKALAIIRK